MKKESRHGFCLVASVGLSFRPVPHAHTPVRNKSNNSTISNTNPAFGSKLSVCSRGPVASTACMEGSWWWYDPVQERYWADKWHKLRSGWWWRPPNRWWHPNPPEELTRQEACYLHLATPTPWPSLALPLPEESLTVEVRRSSVKRQRTAMDD